MKRRKFLTAAVFSVTGFLLSPVIKAAPLINKAVDLFGEYKDRIIALIRELKNEGSSLVKKIMNGKKYVFDPYFHYPYDGGIKDEQTGCQLFFHIHRENEYGHFHTFAADEDGELVHLVLISMDEEGKPIALATVNRWITGDKYVKADVLKKLTENFYVEPFLFKDKRIVEFVNYIFRAYSEEIKQLYDERDKWIQNYVNNNFREPFEDREFEILSERKIAL
jgi:hypothetical protein